MRPLSSHRIVTKVRILGSVLFGASSWLLSIAPPFSGYMGRISGTGMDYGNLVEEHGITTQKSRGLGRLPSPQHF